MNTVETLIDKAAHLCGSRYRLAMRINESESNLSKMARGQRIVTPRVAARLAEIVGDNPKDAACVALVYAEKDPEKRAELARLFGVSNPFPEQPNAPGLLHAMVP